MSKASTADSNRSISVGFIGAGQMARALAQGFVATNRIVPTQVFVADVVPAAVTSFCEWLPGVHAAKDNGALVEQCDLIFLSIKPQSVEAVLPVVRPHVTAAKLFVSIIAGTRMKRLGEGLGTDRMIRVMPNTPCLIGKGASAFCRGTEATDDDVLHVTDLMAAVGSIVEVSEPQLDAVTGLSGSGPAYVYQIIEALSDGGVRVGLPRNIALALAAQTVLGAAAMVLETGEHPAVLQDRVTSPGGTTIAGLKALENGSIRAALIAAVEAATERSRELSE